MEKKQSVDFHSIQKVLKRCLFFNLLTLLLSGVTLVAFAHNSIFEQNYTLNLSYKNAPIGKVLDEVSRQSGIRIAYSNEQVAVKKTVSVNIRTSSIEVALKAILGKEYSFKQIDDYIAIARRTDETSNVQSNNVSQQKKHKISGLVTDTDGNPVIGATVTVSGTTNGVVTDMEGRYTINAAEGEKLIFRFIGFNQEERTVKKEAVINVRMMEASVGLEDVVVIGYGQQKKESVVSSINTISAAQLSMPQRSLKNSVAGQIAGVIAIQRSGEPGNDDAAFWIRGQSSYAGGTSPLVLVDGVPRSMSDIDVDEIETFSVLKDAAATAVYGAEGANGVVLITSKRGKAAKTAVSFNAQYSIVSPTRMPELLPSYEYLSLYNEGLWNNAGNPEVFKGTYTDEVLEKYRTGVDPDLYPNVNWMDLLKTTTHNQRYTLNFRGGSEKTKFFVSTAYYSEDGIFKSNPIEQYDANIGLQRFNLRSNVDMTLSPTTKMAVDMSGQYKMRNAPGTSSDAIFSALTLFPTHLIPMYYSDGTSSDHKLAADGRYNPYNLMNHTGYSKEWQAYIQTKVTLEQQLDFITKGLSVKGSVSFDADFASTTKRTKAAHTFFAKGRDDEGEIIYEEINVGSALSNPTYSASSGTKKIYIEGSFNYKQTFAQKHDVTGLLLYMQKETQSQKVDGLALLPYRKQSLVARATYGYDNRYMLEGSFGATGSENFISGHRWGIFPAVGAAWFVSHEKFMQPVEDLISKLKLRASYGITGNDNIGASSRFPYREALSTSDSGYSMGLNPGSSGGATNGISNGIVENTFPVLTLTWEKETKTNVGADLGLFRGRVDLSVDWFSNERSNILIQRKTIPTASGFRVNPWQNFGITNNKGFDASLIVKQTAGAVNLSARGNITYAKNKVVEYDEIPQAYDYQYYTGNSIGQPLTYISQGLYTPDDFNITPNGEGGNTYTLKPGLPVPSAKVAPGDIKYKDLNEDHIIDSYDMTYKNNLYPNNPQIVYGFGLNAEWKGFFAGIFFQGVAKSSTNLLSQVANFIPFYNGTDNSSARMEALDRWTAADPYNQNVLYPRVHPEKYTHNLENSTWWYRDASFLRLKNVEFGYQFDKRAIQKLHMTNLRVYVQGTNLAVWDNVKYWDPELGSSNSGAKYPICGTWTLGLEVAF